jgi:predicted metalloendopeptidase
MLLQMLHMMNESVPPCEDIRGFSCGAWINDHPLPSTRSIWNQKKQLEFTSKSQIPEINNSFPAAKQLIGK